MAYAVAALFMAAAVFHTIALWAPGVGEPSPPWRHALFVGINTFYAVAFFRRPRWLLVAYAPLAAQQVVSHGAAFLDALRDGRVDWQSVMALASIPLFLWVAASARRCRVVP